MPTFKRRKSPTKPIDESVREKRQRQVHLAAERFVMREQTEDELQNSVGTENELTSIETGSPFDDNGGHQSVDFSPSIFHFGSRDEWQGQDDQSDASFVPDEQAEKDDDNEYDSDEDFLFGGNGFCSLDLDDDSSDAVSEFHNGLSTSESTTSSPHDDQHLEEDAPPTLLSYDDPEEEPPTVHKPSEFSELEVATLELLSLCDGSGARRGLYDDLLTLLRRFKKKKIDITRTMQRKPFVLAISKKVDAPKPKTSTVCGRKVIYYSFIDSLRHLIRSPVFANPNNLCINHDANSPLQPFKPKTIDDVGEIMAKTWASDTQEGINDFDDENDLLLPIMLYGDKTGTDVNQRYPLEPWVFTIPLLRRQARQHSSSWMHLGFMPSLDLVDGSSDKKLQLYHDYMSVLLEELTSVSRAKPVMWVNLGTHWEKRRLHVKTANILGDQKSQDYVCGRVAANNGSAGRIHRGCGCSVVEHTIALANHESNVLPCGDPPTQAIKRLNDLALLDLSDEAEEGPVALLGDVLPPDESLQSRREHRSVVSFLRRVQKLAREILNDVFSMHPHRNAFDGIDFGANVHGVLVATGDDQLHASEAGVMLKLAVASYGGLTAKERTELEGIIRLMVMSSKSSASSEYPRGTVKEGFGRLTLCSHKEKVGSVFYLLLALHDPRGREIIEKAHERQKAKYQTFPTKSQVNKASLSAKKSTKNKNNGKSDDTAERDLERQDIEDETEEASVTEAKRLENKSNTKDEPALPESCFPYRNALLFGSDHNKKDAFDRTDDSIEFVCRHLRLHGFGFLLEETLDRYQLDLLMVCSWPILSCMRKPSNQYPDEDTAELLASQDILKDLVECLQDQEIPQGQPSIVEEDCKATLPRKLPPRTVKMDGAHENPTENLAIWKPESLPIPGCVPKHRRLKPKVKGNGSTCAILSDMPTFLSYLELMLGYHSWCHYSAQLPVAMQEDIPLIHFSRLSVMRYTDAVIYRGDDTVDSATCKHHTQMRDQTEQFGDQMGLDTGVGERGLRDWAKGASQTAVKNGIEIFTQSTAERVSEETLLRRAYQEAVRNVPKPLSSAPLDGRRKAPHFRLDRDKLRSSDGRVLLALNRHGRSRLPDNESGSIQPSILSAIDEIETSLGHVQPIVDIWCEAKLPGGTPIRCWPQYRKDKGSWYDWVMVKFESDDDEDEATTYPGKVLALYEDLEGELKVLIHSTEYKTSSKCEGPFGDSRLVTHYRLQFDTRGDPKLYSVPFRHIKSCILAYESVLYKEPLIARKIRSATERRRHTLMVIRSRDDWAMIFLNWMKELRERQAKMSGLNRNVLKW